MALKYREVGTTMCLLFYLVGVLTGYVTWRITNAPRIWDAEEEAEFYKKEWIALKNKQDIIDDAMDNQ